jgi:hypothetical protein
MRYPTLNHASVTSIAALLVDGENVSIDAQADWSGSGESVDLSALEAITAAANADLMQLLLDGKVSADKEPFEGRLAAEIFPVLDALLVEVLDDPGFWRYVAVRYFWWFIAWREKDPIAHGNVGTYIDAKRNTEQIPLRLYLRAKAVGGDSHLCQAIPKSVDFWRSHVIRVRTGSAEPLSRAFATAQAADRMKTDPLRSYARRLNRQWTNVLLGMYDQGEADALIEELRE